MKTLLSILIFLLSFPTFSQEGPQPVLPQFSTGASFTLNMFQQQVKPEIGDERGERLTFDYGLGLDIYGYFIVNEYVKLGAFLRYDAGSNRAARFDSISPVGTAETSGLITGEYDEIWLGPRLWVGYKGAFAEFGWGFYGTRMDASRTDIPDKDDRTSESFDLNPAFAMQLNAGYQTEIFDDFYLFAKLEWRLRYYDGRGNIPLVDGIEHGTMNINPFIGLNVEL